MLSVRKIVLDVLKPHQPDAIEFSSAIAGAGVGYQVNLTVVEIDAATQTVRIVVAADALDFDAIETAVKSIGGTIHSIDEVEIHNTGTLD